MPDFDDHDDLHGDDEPLEAFCVKCRETVEIEDPQPVWTRKGTPGTRGFCPVCGTTIFRMGRTPAHDAIRHAGGGTSLSAEKDAPARPRPVRIAPGTVYVNAAPADRALAQRLANDLTALGVPTWLPADDEDAVAWAGGIHPALQSCTRMLVVLSPAAPEDRAVRAAWEYFREKRRGIVAVQVSPVDVPDALRRAARVDLSDGENAYRPALRRLVQALAE
jgi:hypothetical protein